MEIQQKTTASTHGIANGQGGSPSVHTSPTTSGSGSLSGGAGGSGSFDSTAIITPAPEHNIAIGDGIKPKTSEFVFVHQQLLSKHNIDVKSLPKELRSDIQFWNTTFARLAKGNADKMAPSLKKRSVVLADKIQDWVEKDYPSKSEEEIQAHIKEKEDADAKAAEEKIKSEEAEAERKKVEAKKKEEAELAERNRQKRVKQIQEETERAKAQLTPEQKQAQAILKALDATGKIHYEVLAGIIGRSVGLRPIKVGSMILRNEYMTNYYYVEQQ